MKNNSVKKLNKSVHTICDFKSQPSASGLPTKETGDPTNTTMTIITTVNTHLGAQKLTPWK